MSISILERPAPTRARGSDFARLARQIKAAGLMERRRGYYAWKVALIASLTLAGIAALVLLGDSWGQLALAGFFAIMFTQLGFLGHDAGHRQIFASHRANYIAGVLFANVAVGLSYGWWVDKHTRHHTHPNDDELDPDVDAGALIFSVGQAGSAGPVGRFFYRFQAWTFFPLLLLEGINLRVASLRYLARAGNPRRGREMLLLGVHMAGYFGLIFAVMSPLHALAFIAVHQGLFGLYLGCSFAPNHKGMPQLTPEQDADFLRRQVLTSRNVNGHWLTDAALGGLNYQIEHHLFPSMPRPNLRLAQPIVEKFCADYGVRYLQTSAVASYTQALRHLNTIGKATRRRTIADTTR